MDENRIKLVECKGRHVFISVDSQGWICTNCGVGVNSIGKFWYGRGLEDAEKEFDNEYFRIAGLSERRTE